VVLDLGVDEALGLIADAVRERRCILFLGAGVHAPPPDGSRFSYPEGCRPPMGSMLSHRLADECDLARRLPGEDPANLQRTALLYEVVLGRYKLVERVTDAVQVGKQPSPMLRALAELGFPVVISTNYDQLFENALQDAGKEPRTVIYSPDRERTVDYGDPTGERPVVFKIHGDISRPKTLVLTDEDYIQFLLRMNSKKPYDPVPLTLKRLLVDWTTVFVGYSLLDFNLRLLFRTLRWKIDLASRPDMYSVDLRPDPLVLDVWHNQRRDVKFVAQDVWAFVPKLYELVLGKELAP
jgi:hypothetical protein